MKNAREASKIPPIAAPTPTPAAAPELSTLSFCAFVDPDAEDDDVEALPAADLLVEVGTLVADTVGAALSGSMDKLWKT